MGICFEVFITMITIFFLNDSERAYSNQLSTWKKQ